MVKRSKTIPVKVARRYHDVFTCYGGATVPDSKMT